MPFDSEEVKSGVNVLLLDENKNVVKVFDQYISLNWAERFIGPGDFELVLPANKEYFEIIKEDRLLSINQSDQYMIIEKIVTSTDPEEGDTMTVTGRTVDSILDRRIIIPSFTIYGSISNGIKKCVNDNAINPSNPKRKIPGLSYDQNGDLSILDQTIEKTEVGKIGLLEQIIKFCSEYSIGFKCVPTEEGFAFTLYTGTDRSWDQSDNPYVVFSKKYENLISTNYAKSSGDYKTVCYVTAEIEWTTKTTVGELNGYNITVTQDHVEDVTQEAFITETDGLGRRETIIESNIDKPEGYENFENKYNWAEYIKQVYQSGLNELYGLSKVEALDGELDGFGQFKYGKDFFLGDVVQVENEYGIDKKCRVSEFVISVDSSGMSYVPTFEFLDDKEEK